METENIISSENIVSSQNLSVQEDEYTNCCGICLTAYKSPRILPCKHIFCRLCLTKLVEKEEDAASDSDEVLVSDEELVQDEGLVQYEEVVQYEELVSDVELVQVEEIVLVPGEELVQDEELVQNEELVQDEETVLVPDKELVPLTCPMCREEINLSHCGVDKLPMYFEDDDEDEGDDVNVGEKDAADEDAGEKDAGDEDQRDVCVVCENSVPAEYECFQCQKVFCVSCKKNHDTWLKHDVHDLKLDLSQDKCKDHPENKVGYFCLECDSTICKECVKSEHNLHQTQTLKSYLMEFDRELKDYASDIETKLETVEMSKVMFFSNTKSIVFKNIENVKNLGEDFKIELEKACRLENKKNHEDKTLLNRIKFMERRIKESRRQRTINPNLISEIEELDEKIATHKNFYLPNNVDDIINNQIGMLDVQIGRLFAFQLKTNLRNVKLNFFSLVI